MLHVFFLFMFAMNTVLGGAEFFPGEWIRRDLHLAQFFVYYGEPEERVKTLQEILEDGCLTGDIKKVAWVIQKQREIGVSLACLDVTKALENLVISGLDHTLLQMPYFLDFFSIDERGCSHLIDVALEVGYPRTVDILHGWGFPLSDAQQKKWRQLREVLNEEPQAIPPVPINAHHHQAHGGEENFAFYAKEYRVSVSYALYYMRKLPCDFRALLENLGHRRRRMAIQGKLKAAKFYGVATDQLMITYYDPIYNLYGQRMREKYPLLPFHVVGKLNAKEILLTQCNADSWMHPDGEHREEILNHVVELCKKVQQTEYPQEKADTLAYDLGKIVWWMSHAPPFLRGTPTVMAILMDAFWIYHNHTPSPKTVDFNCEALLYDKEEEFALYMQTLRRKQNL